LRMAWPRCTFTVISLVPSSLAICLLSRPDTGCARMVAEGELVTISDATAKRLLFGSSLFAPRTRQLDERVEVGNP
jgi:hypothetical protein